MKVVPGEDLDSELPSDAGANGTITEPEDLPVVSDCGWARPLLVSAIRREDASTTVPAWDIRIRR